MVHNQTTFLSFAENQEAKKRESERLALSEEDIRQLITLKTETKNLDYKESLNWDKSSKDEKLEIVKDILAMANTQDGGKIIFGVRNEDFKHIGMSHEDFESFDQTKVNDFSHKYTEPKHSCQVYKHTIDGKRVVAINVPEFEEVPIICKADANSSKDSSKQILKKGQIYIRTDKATTGTISSAEEMREFLGRAISKKGDELLHTIDRLIKGKPLKPTEKSKERYNEEIKEAEAFLSENIGKELKNYGHWAIYAYPTEYVPNRISDQNKIKEIIQNKRTDLGGLYFFPYIDFDNASNFTKGTQSYTIWDMYIEGHRVYESGMFIWKRAFWEDIKCKSDGKPLLEYLSLIQLITGIFLFFKRFYEEIAADSDLHIKLVLHQTGDRKLVSAKPLGLRGEYVAKVDPICIEETIKVVELRASFKEIANNVILQIFRVFNWNDITEERIDRWQTEFLEGRT